ncbi:uncharacterized protein LOC111693964 [Trichogramma pretiosum]|uniref:uncharacterized protein LOC111693964 n=1 Tax=Trichogramma pretiosum TaxID=7493 RepID=UPI000C71B288|nr:uncharacterized protein LOC111693964 [Trichogramma pretiosum]
MRLRKKRIKSMEVNREMYCENRIDRSMRLRVKLSDQVRQAVTAVPKVIRSCHVSSVNNDIHCDKLKNLKRWLKHKKSLWCERKYKSLQKKLRKFDDCETVSPTFLAYLSKANALTFFLARAIIDRDYQMIEYLFPLCKKVEPLDRAGNTAIHLAWYLENDKALDMFFNQIAYSNDKNTEGLSHLHIACLSGNMIGFDKLLSQPRVDLNERYSYRYHKYGDADFPSTPLHMAVESQSLGIIKKLVSRGADKTARDERGRTPLLRLMMISVKETGRLRSVCSKMVPHLREPYPRKSNIMLLLHPYFGTIIQVPQQPQQPQQPEIRNLRLPLQRMIPNRFFANIGQDLFNRHRNYHRRRNHRRVLEEESHPRIEDNVAIRSPWESTHCWVRYDCRKFHVNNYLQSFPNLDFILHWLILAGVSDCDIPDFELCLQDEIGAEIVDILIQNGAPVNHLDQDGNSPLQLAVSYMNIDVVRVLLKYGARVDDIEFAGGYFDKSDLLLRCYEVVDNIVQIVDALERHGFDMTPEQNITIMTFLLDTDAFFKKSNMQTVLCFGSSDQIRSYYSSQIGISTQVQREKCILSFYHGPHYLVPNEREILDVIIETRKCRAEMSASGLYFKWDDETIMLQALITLQTHLRVSVKHFDVCNTDWICEQAEAAKAYPVNGTTTLYDLATMNPTKLFNHMPPNKDIRKFLADRYLRQTASIILRRLNGQMARIKISEFVRKRVMDSFATAVVFTLPHLCSEHLIRVCDVESLIPLYIASLPQDIPYKDLKRERLMRLLTIPEY